MVEILYDRFRDDRTSNLSELLHNKCLMLKLNGITRYVTILKVDRILPCATIESIKTPGFQNSNVCGFIRMQEKMIPVLKVEEEGIVTPIILNTKPSSLVILDVERYGLLMKVGLLPERKAVSIFTHRKDRPLSCIVYKAA